MAPTFNDLFANASGSFFYAREFRAATSTNPLSQIKMPFSLN
ncbi:hypothetical protein CAter282_1538 [Collimonas arenae]|uniref:Uncharacterized protein n=1 Tax=Collimonas arenae TaxID=279058 RepID=A0A127PNV1_9BURK|nr:hypothetical protein CAter10_1664 [Collimonas arenae]AMP09324.1 hypothetical protein CAter282_1538 [Collimonas arenae]